MPLLLALLVLFAVPLSAQTTIPTLLTPEQPVAEPHVGPIPGGAADAIATDGTNFLIDSTAVVKFVASGRWVMLVDGKGRPLLKTSIALGPSAWAGAGAAWSGHEYLLAWADPSGQTNAVRIDREGNVLDPKPIQLPGSGNGGYFRVVVWDGAQFVVLQANVSGPGPVLVAMRVSESGELLQKGIVFGTGFGGVAAAAANGVTVILWSEPGASHFRTMNAAGALGPITDIATPLASIDAAAGADGFLLRVGTLLQHLSPSGQADAPPFSLPAVRLTSAGADYLVVLASQQAVHINGSGAFVDAPRAIPSLPAPNAIMAATASDAVIAWYVDGPTTYDPETTFDRALESTDVVQTHRGYMAQSTPRVVWHGGIPLVSWTEDMIREQTVGTADAAAVSATGDIELAVASGPQATLHVFQRGTPGTMQAQAQYALYVFAEGGEPVVLDPTIVYGYNARAVWTGRDFIVVWIRPGTTDVMGARIDANGKIVNGPDVIASADSVLDMALGASDANVLFVWKDRALAHGVLLTPSGEVATEDITTLDDLQYAATSFSIASDGREFLITWVNKSHTANPSNDWIAGKLMDANGHVLTPLEGFSPGGDEKTIAATFWTGSNYLTIWETTPGLLSAARITAEGRLLDYPPAHVGDVDGNVTSIARTASGPVVVAYTRSDVRYTPVRAFTRFIVPARERAVARR